MYEHLPTTPDRNWAKHVTNGSDYHVVSLTYSVKSTKDVTYDSPPPVAFETSEARFHLADAKLTCHMKSHVSTEAAARAVVEPILRAWELAADLRVGRAELGSNLRAQP